jgi:SM-20-related protein
MFTADHDDVTAAARVIVERIASAGYGVVENALAPEVITTLRERLLALEARGELVAAAIGRGASRRNRTDVRGDRIRWLDEAYPAPAEAHVWRMLEMLRDVVNRELMLGLWSFEGHYALYPPGAVYARHRDRFRDDDARVLSCVAYLNDAWRDGDGGALRLHLAAGPRDVLPRGGTLVAFLADGVEHEVLPAQRQRLSVSGWFRRRAPER